MDAIILAGERNNTGTDLPRALIRVHDKELLSHQIGYLKDKVNRIIVSVGSGKSSKIIEKFVYDSHPGLAIICVPEEKPLGTAGAIKNCISSCGTDRVLVVNCGDLCDINMRELVKIPGNVICVQSPRLPFGIIKRNTDTSSRLLGRYSFLEKPVLKGIQTNCGWYILEARLIRNFPIIGSLEYNVFPKINFNIFRHLGKWNSFRNPKDAEIYELNNKN